jgi:predicted NBD/HSP70 family sugar kinase
VLIVDLKGQYYHRKVYEVPYENTQSYIQNLCETVNRYIESLPYTQEQILGVGFSFQGLVNAEGTRITYGKILDCTGLTIDSFSRWLHYPCRFLHDAAAAADSELWASPELSDFIYMNISIHLGATIIHDRKILPGKHGYSGTIEHIQIVPNGKKCYCGRQGCIETVCSMNALLGEDEEDTFFEKKEAGDPAVMERWRTYLYYLALSINNMHLLYNEDFVLGGYLASRLYDADLACICENIEKLSPFPENIDYIHVSKMPKHNITIGAALPYIRNFLAGELIPMKG